MSTPSIAERVAAGAAWLDANVENWWQPERIDLERLNLESCIDCMLGQIFGHYYSAPAAGDGPSLGFNRWDHLDAPYEDLTREWVRVIQERRTQAEASS